MEIGHQQARKYLQELHADGDLYISGWTRKGRATYHAIYGIRKPGAGYPDEPRPEPLTQSEIMKRFRASIRSKEQYAHLKTVSR